MKARTFRLSLFKTLSFFGTVVGISTHALSAESVVVQQVDRILDQSSLGVIAAQKDFLSVLDPGALACERTSIRVDAQPEVDVGAYSCSFDVDEAAMPNTAASPIPLALETPLPVPSETPPSPKELKSVFSRIPGSLTVGVSTGNDNYPGRFQKKSSDDTAFDAGHTFDMKVSAVKVFGKDGALGKKGDAVGVEVGTELFSHPSGFDTSAYSGMLQAKETQNATGFPASITGADGTTRSVYLSAVQWTPAGSLKLHQQSLDRTYLTVMKEWNREKFTIIGEVTVDKRVTTGEGLGPQIQNGWHRMGGASYVYTNEDASGTPSTWDIKKIGTRADPSGNSIDVVDVKIQPGIAENTSIKKYGNWGTSVGGGIQKDVRIFRGTCELLTSATMKVGVQGGNEKTTGIVFDPNSRFQVGSTFGTSLIPNRKWDDSKLSLKTGAALIYFPKPVSGSPIDWNASTELQSNHHIGSRGNMLQTGIQFYGPGLGGVFRDIDDREKIFQLSIRYILVGKKK